MTCWHSVAFTVVLWSPECSNSKFNNGMKPGRCVNCMKKTNGRVQTLPSTLTHSLWMVAHCKQISIMVNVHNNSYNYTLTRAKSGIENSLNTKYCYLLQHLRMKWFKINISKWSIEQYNLNRCSCLKQLPATHPLPVSSRRWSSLSCIPAPFSKY